MKSRLVTWLRKLFDIASKDTKQAVVEDIKLDLLALNYLAPLSEQFVPWTQPALRPSSLVVLLNDIIVNARMQIVECGGGVSTVYIAKLLKQRGAGHLYTIEHDAEWASLLNDMLGDELRSFVTIIHAPLVSNGQGDWYEQTVIEATIKDVGIDLLIVDGPPASPKQPKVRRPAELFFRKYLAQEYALALDDVRRKGEKGILEEWRSVHDLKFRVVGGLALGISNEANNSFI